MRTLKFTAPKVAVTIASCVVVVATATVSRAAPMDLTPERFRICTGSGTSISCAPNNVPWANMTTELGYAIAPSAFHAARTTGLGGFALSFEASYAHINADAKDSTGTQYWHEGTQGAVDPASNKFSIVNNGPDSILQIYSLKARKGLPFGFEVTGALGYLANTSMWVGGADLHWAPLEGFRTGILGYLPDIALGGGVRTLGGSPELFLTTVGLDGQISKPFTLADAAVLTPYIGVQRLWIYADSTAVDLSPNVDPIGAQCGYQGTNTPYGPGNTSNPNAPGNTTGAYDGQPICKTPGGNSAFNNLATFNHVRVERVRGIIGVTYRYEILYLAGEFATDLEDPGAEGQQAAYGISGSKQWTTSFEVGVSF